MGTITERKRKDGTSGYRVQIAITRDGHIVRDGRTFETRARATAWLQERETEIASGSWLPRGHTLGSIIQRYIEEYEDLAGWGRSKAADLRRLQLTAIAQHDVETLKSRHFVEHVVMRRKGGAGPSTTNNDLIWMRVVLKAARAGWGYQIDLQQVEDAVNHCRNQRLIGNSKKRDRRPTEEEIKNLHDYFSKPDGRRSFDMAQVFEFAILTTRREAEITRLLWSDLDEKKKIWLLRNAKDPRGSKGNHKVFKITKKALLFVQSIPKIDGEDRVFPYKTAAIRARFERACKALGIKDLRFHDLRHEGTSRLFEMGYQIHEVAQFTLHERWETLKRYTQLRPEDVRDL